MKQNTDMQAFGEYTRAQGYAPDEENIFLGESVPRKESKRAQRLFDGRIIWQCSECEAIIEVNDDTGEDNNFLMSCEGCFVVHKIII